MSEGDDTGVSPQSGEQKTEDKKPETNSMSVPGKKTVEVAEEVATENGHGDVKDNEIKENNVSEDVESPKEKVDELPQENKEVTKDKESDPPKSEEMDVSKSHDDTLESETSSTEHVALEEETPMEESEPVKDQSKSEKSELDGEAESTPKPKQGRKKGKRGPSYYYEEVNEGDEEALGSVERTPVVESGKRERKKVERLAMSSTFTPPEKKPLEIPEGSGDRLGDSPAIEFQLNRHRGSDLKALHRILFGTTGVTMLTKKNIRQFSGFAFDKKDKEYQKKMDLMNKLFTPVLKDICKVLDIERSGTKESIIQRILDFLMCPKFSDKKVVQPAAKTSKTRKRRATKKEMEERRKLAEKQSKTKQSKKGVAEEEEQSGEDEESGEEEEGGEEEEVEEEEEEEEEVSEEEPEPEPPKKKKKVETPSPKKAAKKEDKSAKKPKKQNQKEETKKETKKESKKETKKENKKETKKEAKKEKTPKKEKVEKKKQAFEDESSEEDEPLVKKRKEAPGNDELKDLIKKILDGADLEKVTMKTVVKQVYGKYPDFDLTDRKEFIKNTVKQIIS